MADYTDDFGLIRLGPGDTLATDNYKFGTTDRDIIARVLRIGAETHHHNGAAAANSGIDVGARNLALTHGSTYGGIPAGVRVYYVFTLMVDGFESEPSDPVFVDTPAPVASPAAPTLTTASTGGSLLPGNYYYMLSAFTTSNTDETRATNAAFINVPSGTATNTVTVTFPTLPAGATGFNVYRKKPGGVRYDYLTSITGSGPTFVDTGAIEEDCNRTISPTNYTNRMNHVVVDLEGDPLDPGVTWRLYRTYAEGDYLNSRIADVTSGTTFDDTGATGSGSPPSASIEVASPSKIMLTDGEEVQGLLPLGMIAFPFQITLSYPGPLDVAEGSSVWTNEYPFAEIVYCRAVLGRDSVPASTPVIVDVIRYNSQAATPSWGSIYPTSPQPDVDVGEQVGDPATPDVIVINRGDMLTMNIDQTGGGATPTDRDLTLSIYMIGYGYPATTSYVPGASGGTGGEF